MCFKFDIGFVLCSFFTDYGSWHYNEDEQLKVRIVQEHELPPERQDVFKIINYSDLNLALLKYYGSRKRSGTIQSYDSRAKHVR